MLVLVFIFGGLIGFLIGLGIGVCIDGNIFEYLKFIKQQEFEKEKYYSEYADKHQGKGV